MTYYFFDRCNESSISQIESLARELGLKEEECNFPVRQWSGNIFDSEIEFNRFLLLTYDPISKRPLMAQTAPPITHQQADVKKVLKRLIDICKPDSISADIFEQEEGLYDLMEFE